MLLITQSHEDNNVTDDPDRTPACNTTPPSSYRQRDNSYDSVSQNVPHFSPLGCSQKTCGLHVLLLFLVYFFTIPVGPITSKSTGPIVAKFSGLVERACNDLVAVL